MQLAVLSLLLLLIGLSQQGNFNKKELRADWKMVVTKCPKAFQSLVGQSFSTTVPATLHLVLEKYNQIPNPYFGTNLRALSSLSECDVNFTTTLQLSSIELDSNLKIALIFEGIDTYSTVYLNDIRLGATDNAFVKYEYQIKKHLKAGGNELTVSIKSPKPHDSQRQKTDRMPFEYAHTRKACYQYSWDWAPYMNTLGIWLPVSLNFYHEVKIDYIWFRLAKIQPNLQAELDIVVALEGVDAQANLKDRNLSVSVKRMDNGEAKQFTLLAKYSNIKLSIIQPKLWWPNGIGQPHVYEFEFTILKGSEVQDRKISTYGIRTVKLDQTGPNFQLMINGHPIYCKGANYVPPDMMYSRLINSDFHPKNSIENLLNDAVESNYNMLRLWGGGQYESEQFFELASRKGIMIFHDFMFSDSIYPGTDQFLENVKQEIVYQVRRVRNYPALVLWSGNNQILQGIQSWGWGQPKYQQNYKKLFKQLIPDILRVQCDNLPYIESSPSKGVGNAGFHAGGDIHFWGVWAAGVPFESYESAQGMFNSQFGTQSLPVWQTILQFTDPHDRAYESDKMLFHEKHMSRFSTLQKYMRNYAKQSINFELQTYNSGLVHAHAMEIAIRAQRAAKPKSWGTLYWMFNDAWPAISWASIDYYGRWKAVQYSAKRYYKDIILYYHPHSQKFVAVNDKLYPVMANYLIEVVTFDGMVLLTEDGSIELKQNEKKELFQLDQNIYAGHENKVVIYTEMIYGMKEENRSILTTFLKAPKDLQLQPAELTVHYLYGTNEIILSSDKLIKSLYISNSQKYLKFSDNYFDLVPGKQRQVKLTTAGLSLKDLKGTMVYRSYRQVYQTEALTINYEN